MVSITFSYLGDLHCEATHGPSGTVIDTDAPKDNQGKGEAFSPTDLLATSLATCALTTMALVARRFDLDLTGATASIEKHMSAEAPRRVAALPLTLSIPVLPSDEAREQLEAAALGCPVMRSLHPEVVKPMTFHWGPADAAK